MNFLQAVAEVNGTTKRPDKDNLVRRKINAAISFFSLDSEFSRDFVEQLVAIDPLQYTQAIALSSLTRFRRFKYMKLAGTKQFLTVLPDSELFDKSRRNCNRYYIAGDNVNIYTSALAANLDIGYFSYPPLLDGSTAANSYWMLDMAPFMIIDWALAEVFKDVGDEKSFTQHRATAREQFLAFKKDQGIVTL